MKSENSVLRQALVLFCLVLCPIASNAEVVDIEEIVAKYAAQRNKLRSISAVARFSRHFDSSGPVTDYMSEWYVKYDFRDQGEQTRVTVTMHPEYTEGEDVDLFADYSADVLYRKRGEVVGYGSQAHSWHYGGKVCLSADLKPWLLMDFAPAVNHDPRMTLEDLLAYSPITPVATAEASGRVRIQVGWPVHKSVRSAESTVGELAIVIDPSLNHSAVEYEKRYRYLSDDVPADADAPLTWLQRITVKKSAFDTASGIVVPLEVHAESYSLAVDGSETLVFKEVLSVLEYQLNESLEDQLGFRFDEGSIVHVLGSYDGSIPTKFSVMDSSGRNVVATFADQGDAIEYVLAKHQADATEPQPAHEIPRQRQFLPVLVGIAFLAAVLCLLLCVYWTSAKRT